MTKLTLVPKQFGKDERETKQESRLVSIKRASHVSQSLSSGNLGAIRDS